MVREIIRLVSDQKHQAEQANRSLDRIILIGGFGDSDFLHNQLKQWCMVNGGIKLLVPDHPQAAIVRGAAIRGLEGTAPRKKRCRRYYGVTHSSLFKDGIDPEERAYIDRWDGAKRCSGKMTWLIQKGDIITKDTKASINLFLSASRHDELYTTDQLYSCSLDDPPEYSDHPRVERVTTIRTDFSGIDKSKVPHKRTHGLYGTKLFCLTFEVVVEFGRQSGVLEFKTLVGGKVSGLTTVTYD